MATPLTTTLNRNWVLKMVAFLVVLAGFGTWGLADGLWIYPARGEKDASYKLFRYLETARDSGRLTQADVAVENPRAAFAELEGRERDLNAAAQGKSGPGGISSRVANFELARLHWLRSLKRVWRIDSAPDRLEKDLQAQLASLTATWKTTTPPKPLDAFDLLFQWVFVALGYGSAAWLVITLIRARARTFTWDPDQHRLTLPSGAAITPDAIAEFDKRKWHKLFITLNLKDGSSHTLDLLRYVPLEAWVLELEKIVNPPADEPAAEQPAEPIAAGHAPDEAEQNRANA
jgi:hypothetical protein